MCIILYHRKTKIPNHLNDCILKIRQYSNIPIYLITDSDYKNENIITIDSKKYDNLNWLDDFYTGVHYRNDQEYHMWRESSYRFFYIEKLIEEKNLVNVLTFDNDVLLYENPDKIIEKINLKYTKITITPQNINEVVMGMCYIPSAESIKNIVNYFKNEYSLTREKLKQKYDGYPTEMRLLAKYNDLNFFPILPDGLVSDRYSNNFNYFNSVFDPAGYGMYIGGLSPMNEIKPKPGWFHSYQEIGKQIGLGNIKIIFEDRNPYLIYNNTRIKINNLHIHSKETHKYM
jgi:hypothetical protein